MLKLWAEEKGWKGKFDATVRFILACIIAFGPIFWLLYC